MKHSIFILLISTLNFGLLPHIIRFSVTIKNIISGRIITTLLLLSMFFMCGTNSFAQQDPLFSQYMFDRLIINPGFAGSSNVASGTLSYRKQFIGIEGSPETQVFSIHAPIQTKFMGVGLKIIHDKVAVTDQTSITGIYTYHLGLANGKLSLGLEGGIINQSIDFPSRIRTDPSDNAIPINKESIIVPDAAFGVYYHSDELYFGVSAYHLLQGKLNYTDYERTPTTQLSRHYFLINGYSVDFSENIKIEPSWLLKYVAGAPLQGDLNISVTFNEMFTIGGSYRTGDGMIFLVKYSFKNRLKFGYSYDYTISKLASYNNGSHEIMLSYNIQLLEPAKKKVVDPRYYF